MRKLTLLLIMCATLLLGGCVATTNVARKCICPSTDVIYFIQTPMGLVPSTMPKGYFDEESKGKKWMERKEFEKEMLKEYKKRQKEKKGKKANARNIQ